MSAYQRSAHSGRQRPRQHHPRGGLRGGEHGLREGVDDARVDRRAAFVEFRCGAVGFGDREIDTGRLVGGNTPKRHRAGLERGDQRIGAGSRQQRHGVHAGQCQRPCDVDSLAAGFGGDGLDSVDRTAGQGRRQSDRPIDARVGGDGDDHAVTTSTPCSASSARSAVPISPSVMSVSTLEIGAKLTRSSRPTFDESAATTT